MKIPKTFRALLMLTLLGGVFCVAALAQSAKKAEPISAVPFEKNGAPVTDRTEVKWKISAEYSSLILTVSTPDGEVIRQEFKAGELPAFKLADGKGAPLPDGQYIYEMRLIPNLPSDVSEALTALRQSEEQDALRELGSQKSDSAPTLQELRKSGKLPNEAVHNGAFLIEKGVVYMGSSDDRAKGGSQPSSRDPKISQQRQNPWFDSFGRNQAVFMPAVMGTFDQVIPDDLIVQGSACVGFDCVNGEVFDFDTIRLKENNLRINFTDTSVGAFPTNDWELTANDSASGGASRFSIRDVTAARDPFTVRAGAAANSIFVDSTGRVGLRTGTPVLDLHVNTSNTPAHRLEQNSSGGFTAQTWDVAGNEANFFVRDVTGGSRLPFRIRPGAPTSSLDIAASGNVGVGTASPARKLHVSADGGNVGMRITDTGLGNAAFMVYLRRGGAALADRQFSIFDENAVADRLVINATGNIGLGGVVNPTSPILHLNGASLSAGGVWTNGSSRALKTDIRNLSTREAFNTLQRLTPVTFQYKADPTDKHVGFIAEDVPELVATTDRKGLSSMDIVAVLTKVVQEQQQTIAELKVKVEQLEKASAKKTRSQKKR